MIDANMNNAVLVEKSGISISRVSNIRNGANCTFETAEKIAKALDVDVMELIERGDVLEK